MWTVTQVSQTLQCLVTTTANQLARETGFVQRASKVTGATFVQTLLFGWLNNPQATLQQLAQMAGSVGVAISPQGLDQRFTPTAAGFLQRLLEAAVTHVVTAHPVTIPLIQRFAGVYLLDSSTIVLPDELSQVWRGCGGNQAQHTQAALKLQVQLDVSTGALRGPWLQDGRGADQAAPNQTTFPPGALRLADLGYFSLAVLHELSTAGGSWLSRLHLHTHVFDQTGTCLDVLLWLSKQQVGTHDLPIALGAQDRLNARLLAVRVPAQVAQQRRRRLRKQARRKGQTPSQRHLALADWTVLVTNVPADLLSLEEALVLLRARWQVELLFKLWKSLGRLDESRSAQPWRRLCELYAKMLALLVQHWLLVLSCWQYPDRSLTQAAQTIQRYATSLALALRSRKRLGEVLASIQQCLQTGCRITRRRQHPCTYQLLLDSSILAS
jgi:DDE family transposase